MRAGEAVTAGATPPAAVVFDFGGVLFDWSPPVLLQQVLPHRVGSHAAGAALAQDFFQGYGGDWLEFDRGTVQPDALAQRIAARTGLAEAEVRAVMDAVPQHLAPLQESVALLEALHAAGWPLYFLSNMPAPYADHLERTHGFIARFADGVFSARVQAVKPDRDIFEIAAQRFGHAPGRLLFLDDVLHNVQAAQAAGWRALHFQGAAQARAELAAHGVHLAIGG